MTDGRRAVVLAQEVTAMRSSRLPLVSGSHAGPVHRIGFPTAGLCAPLVVVNLGCFTFDAARQGEQRQGQDDLASFSTGIYLTDQYAKAARQANQGRAAQFAATGLSVTKPFPEALQLGSPTGPTQKSPSRLSEVAQWADRLEAANAQSDKEGIARAVLALGVNVCRVDPSPDQVLVGG